MDPKSRVWIYQSNRPFSDQESAQIQDILTQFAGKWTSHNQALQAKAELRHQRFVILMVDETQAGASGCSIDASVHFIKNLGAQFGVDFFDRMAFAYRDEETINVVSKEDFAEKYRSGQINDATLVFDHLVNTKEAFEEAWLKPLEQSWHKRFV